MVDPEFFSQGSKGEQTPDFEQSDSALFPNVEQSEKVGKESNRSCGKLNSGDDLMDGNQMSSGGALLGSAELDLTEEVAEIPEELDDFEGALFDPTVPTDLLRSLLCPITAAAETEASSLASTLSLMTSGDVIEAGDAFYGVAERVLGRDDRVRILRPFERVPFRQICFLDIRSRNGQRMRGTGWLANEDTVITAGHCVFDRAGYVRSVGVFAGLDGSRNAASVRATRAFASPQWERSFDSALDYGALKLAEPIGRQLGFFNIGVLSPRSAVSRIVNVAGYSADKPGRQLWTHADAVVSANRNELFYRIDTYPGASGSPVVFINRGGEPFAIGIHNRGGSNSNMATRINNDLTGPQIRQWMQERA